MADKHYAGVPRELLDQAVTWLGEEYGLVERPEPANSEKPEAQPSDPAPSPEPVAVDPAAESEAPSSRDGRRSKTAKARPVTSRRPKAKSVPGA